MDAIFFYSQIAAMQCYQLSRIHYCFSRQQIHSNKGYPKWLFLLFFAVVAAWYFLEITILDIALPTIQCGIDNHGDSYFVEVELFGQNYYLILFALMFVLFIIDLATVIFDRPFVS